MNITELNHLMATYGIQPCVIDQQLSEHAKHALLVDHAFPRLQQEHYFNNCWNTLDKHEKALFYFLAIHGGDISKNELLHRYFKRREKALEEIMKRLNRAAMLLL